MTLPDSPTPAVAHVATETIHLLLVEDEPTDAAFTRAMLEQVHDAVVTTHWAKTASEGIEELESGRYDVALVDYMLGADNGLDLIRLARQRELDTPLILLTGKGSREVDLEAQQAGAADYLVKGQIDPAGLERSLRYTLERQRSLEALRESEARFRGLFDHLPMGLFRCTADGGFLDANPALVQLLGNPDAILLQERFAASFYVHPSDVERFRAALDGDGVVRGFESWLERDDGFHVPVRTTARAYNDESGRVSYVEGAVESVPGTVDPERLRIGASRFRATLERLPVAIAVLDSEGHVLDAAPALSRVARRRAADLVTSPLDSFLLLDQPGRFEAALDTLRSGAVASLRLEGKLTGPKRAPLPCTVTLAPVLDDESELTEVVALFTPPGP